MIHRIEAETASRGATVERATATWVWMLSAVEELASRAAELSAEVRREDSPLHGLFDWQTLNHFACKMHDETTLLRSVPRVARAPRLHD